MATPPRTPTRNPSLCQDTHRWLQPVIVRMLPPAPHEDSTPEAILLRRVAYYHTLMHGAAPETRWVKLPPGTCLVCGCYPIATPGGYQCSACVEAQTLVNLQRTGGA